MGIFVSDTFSGETVTTILTDHTGEIGATWAVITGITSPSVSAATFSVFALSDSTTHAAYASGTPSGNEYDVECDVEFSSFTNACDIGPIARSSTDAQTFYHLQYDSSAGIWKLFKVVAGSFTSLGTYSQTIGLNTPYNVRLEIKDATKKVFIDDVERISSNNNDITQDGRAGLRLVRPASGTTRGRIDNFVASEETVTTLAPTTIASTTLAPTTLEPTTTVPTTEVTTIAPTTLAPTTITPTSLAPTTLAPPTTIFQTTSAPTTKAPTSLEPTTLPPTTVAPTTKVTTLAPTTDITTLSPTTITPTTLSPTTLPPTTLPPTTTTPTTEVTTLSPTTIAPTTLPPTTIAPTTKAPTTIGPTTLLSTTLAPTTLTPTTTLTTSAPTTAPPAISACGNKTIKIIQDNLVIKISQDNLTVEITQC